MFLYYIPQPNKQQPHNVVLKNPLKKRNWNSFSFPSLKLISTIFVGTCSLVSLVFFCPDHYQPPPKRTFLVGKKIWKHHSMSMFSDVTEVKSVPGLIGDGISINYDVKISYLFPTSICFVCLQSNAVFAVKDQNCLDLRNLGLQTFHSLSQEIQKTTNAKNVAIHWKYTAPDL